MLISSSDETLTSQFEGYAFVGADYVYGPSGLKQFERETGSSITPGHDGCYVSACWVGDEYIIGVDSRGLGRLFAYQHAGEWTIASSLYELVAHVRGVGLPLTPMPEMLSAFRLDGSFFAQMTSLDTIFAEIELLPSRAQVIASHQRLTLRTVDRTPQQTYEVALYEYLHMWRARALTLLRDPRITFSTDLSGGFDSRAVMALLLSTHEFSTDNPRHQVLSATSKVDDYRAASGLAGTYGFELNGPVQRPPLPKSGVRAMRTWRAHCLGTYRPVYLAPAGESPFFIRGHGAGGGNHRTTFNDANITDRTARYASARNPETHRRWARSVEASLHAVSADHPGVHPMVVHYREFRSRFHFGHAPHQRAMFMPLSSGLLDVITDREDSRTHRQFYFDIMESLAPGIIELPFDEPRKSPTEVELGAVTTVSLDDRVTAGRVYAAENVDDSRDDSDANLLWLDIAHRAIAHQSVRDFLGEELLSQSLEALREMHEVGRIPSSNSSSARLLSYVHFVAFALVPEVHATLDS